MSIIPPESKYFLWYICLFVSIGSEEGKIFDRIFRLARLGLKGGKPWRIDTITSI